MTFYKEFPWATLLPISRLLLKPWVEFVKKLFEF